MSTLGVCSFGFLDVVFLFKFGLMLFVWFGHFSFRVFAPRLFPPRPSFLELRSMVPARFGRTGQLGLPSCLFGHTSSFGWGGWCFPSCRCCSFVAYFCRGVARTSAALPSALLAARPCCFLASGLGASRRARFSRRMPCFWQLWFFLFWVCFGLVFFWFQ